MKVSRKTSKGNTGWSLHSKTECMERKGGVVGENGACSKLHALYLSRNICEEQEKWIKAGRSQISVECHTGKSK